MPHIRRTIRIEPVRPVLRSEAYAVRRQRARAMTNRELADELWRLRQMRRMGYHVDPVYYEALQDESMARAIEVF